MIEQQVGGISAEDALRLDLPDQILRAAGVDFDVRKDTRICFVYKVDFDIPVGEDGSVFIELFVRMEEMRQSIRIIEQLIDGIPEGPLSRRFYRISSFLKNTKFILNGRINLPLLNSSCTESKFQGE